MLEILKSLLFGIVEGITEWLPVSSTGHMILFDEFVQLNMSAAFKEMYLVVIQLGAILAVVLLFWDQIWPFQSGAKYDGSNKVLPGWIKENIFVMWLKIVVACVPAVIIELAAGDYLEALFYNYKTVSIMLIVVGILFIIVEDWNKKRTAKITSIADITVDRSRISGNVPFGGNNHRRTDSRTFQTDCGRVYILSCNPGYVWCKSDQAVKIWISLYRFGGRCACSRHDRCISCIRCCDTVSDGLY